MHDRVPSPRTRIGSGMPIFGIMYSHISTGWYGKEWGGDHQALEDCLRLYAAAQSDGGFIRWVSPSLMAFDAENNTPYWVDHVWWHYAWTGDRQFVRDLWPQRPQGRGLAAPAQRSRRRRPVPRLVRVLELRLQRQRPQGRRPQRHVVGHARSGRPACPGCRRYESRGGVPRPCREDAGSDLPRAVA